MTLLNNGEDTRETIIIQDKEPENTFLSEEKISSDGQATPIISQEWAEKEATQEKPEKMTQAKIAINLLKEKVICFRDDTRTSYIGIKKSDYLEVLPTESSDFKQFILYEYLQKTGNILRNDAISDVVRYFVINSQYEKMVQKIEPRITRKKDESIWYDLWWDNWRCLRILPNEWTAIPHNDPTFCRTPTQKEQVMPIKGGDVWKIFDFLNVPKEKRILVLVVVIALFIPDIQHPILLVHGSRGASKSTFSKVIKNLVDPETPELLSFPNSNNELIRILNRSYYIAFDNLSQITHEWSDTLCRAITGEWQVKRKLFTDNEDIVISFRRSICLNGINAVATRPDLLDRSISVEMERISQEKRMTDEEFWKSFECEKPAILWGIFDVLAKALDRVKTVKLDRLPRMADFAKYGFAIADALGWRGKEFLEDYMQNEEERNDMVLDDDVVAHTLLTFINLRLQATSKTIEKIIWSGSPTDLYKEVRTIAENERQGQFFPKLSAHFMKKVNEIKVNIRDEGYSIEKLRKHSGREIYIKYLGKTNENEDTTEADDSKPEALAIRVTPTPPSDPDDDGIPF